MSPLHPAHTDEVQHLLVTIVHPAGNNLTLFSIHDPHIREFFQGHPDNDIRKLPILDTLASYIQSICQLSHPNSLVKWIPSHATQNIRIISQFCQIFEVKGFHDPVWSHRGIHLCYPSLSCPTFCMEYSAS